MIIPQGLKKGDKLWIVSPAGKIKDEHLHHAVEWLKSEGYRVETGRHALNEHYQFAGTDNQRLGDLQQAFDDDDAAAVLCARGGYGTMRLLDKLNFDKLIQHPKWLVGFSDITCLHNCLNNHGIATIHGVMPRYYFSSNNQPGENLKSLMQLITGSTAQYVLPSSNICRKGKATGQLVGGNLSVMSCLMGTPHELRTDGRILFLEDIDEYLYHTDRLMQQLRLAGKLENLAGLVAGRFTNMKDNTSPFGRNAYEIIAEATRAYNFPVCYGFPAGHDDLNLALAFGMDWELTVDEENTTLRLVQQLVT